MPHAHLPAWSVLVPIRMSMFAGLLKIQTLPLSLTHWGALQDEVDVSFESVIDLQQFTVRVAQADVER